MRVRSIFPNLKQIKSISTHFINSNLVTDKALKSAVESIGATKWWDNSKNGYSFQVNAADGASFQVGLDEGNNIFMFLGMVSHNGKIFKFTDTAELKDTAKVLEAMSKPTAKEIIDSFHNDVGITED